ncbi:hypothetical protein Tco_1194836 [Tanacetum coccineum]
MLLGRVWWMLERYSVSRGYDVSNMHGKLIPVVVYVCRIEVIIVTGVKDSGWTRSEEVRGDSMCVPGGPELPRNAEDQMSLVSRCLFDSALPSK